MNSTKYLFVLMILAALALAVVIADNDDNSDDPSADDDDFDDVYFQDYKSRYSKEYDDGDEPVRKQIFKANRRRANKLKQQNPEADFGDTPFMDMTPEEFTTKFLMKGVDEKLARLVMPEAVENSTVFDQRSIEATPTSFDWRSRGAVTPVKNQRSCGSCWAFSVAETIESALFLAGRGLKVLSPQQIVSCDRSNWACNGGWPGNAYNYVKNAGGIQLESTYPYTATKGTCNFDRTKVAGKITGWAFVSQTSNRRESAMTTASYNYGPLSVCLCASSWQYYTRGVLSNCCTTIDHCTQITGWGTENGTPYWWVRNSWGSGWGQSGYLKIRRGSNTCRIADYVTRAIV